MKTGKYYFYEESTQRSIPGKYIVYEVNSFNGNIDEADRKARTIAQKHNKKLAGGYFSEDCKPQTEIFKKNYKVIKVKDNTKIDPYNVKDLFIIDLIEKEKSIKFVML